MPYKSDAQRKFMHAQHPEIAKKWDDEIRSKKGGKVKVNKVYKTGTPVAHKNMTLDPTGYVNREVNKGTRTQKPSTRRAGVARLALQRAAERRAAIQKARPKMLRG